MLFCALNGLIRPHRQSAYLVRDNRKSFARRTYVGSLNGSVNSQNIGLFRNILDILKNFIVTSDSGADFFG